MTDFDLASLLQQVREEHGAPELLQETVFPEAIVGTIGKPACAETETADAGGIDILDVLEEVTSTARECGTQDGMTPLESVMACMRESSTHDLLEHIENGEAAIAAAEAQHIEPAHSSSTLSTTSAPLTRSTDQDIPTDTCSSTSHSSQVVSFDMAAPVWEYQSPTLPDVWLGYYSFEDLEGWVAHGAGGLRGITIIRCAILDVEASFDAVNNGDVVINSSAVLSQVSATERNGVNPNALPWQPVAGAPQVQECVGVPLEPLQPAWQNVPKPVQNEQRAATEAWAAAELVKLLKANQQIHSYVPAHCVASHLATVGSPDEVRSFLLAEFGNHSAVGTFFDAYCERRFPFAGGAAPAVVSPVTATPGAYPPQQRAAVFPLNRQQQQKQKQQQQQQQQQFHSRKGVPTKPMSGGKGAYPQHMQQQPRYQEGVVY